MIADIYNTALYNKVLEAMDKGQIVVFKEEHGYDVVINSSWLGNSIKVLAGNNLITIYPEADATNLYTPTNLTP
jgi:hypothetical protein